MAHNYSVWLADSLQQVLSQGKNEHDAAEQLYTCMHENKVQEVIRKACIIIAHNYNQV